MSTNDDQSRISNIVKAIGAIIAVAFTVLPATWAARLGKVREAIVAAAGSAVSVAAAFQGLPFVTGTVSEAIAYVGIVATAILTHWTAQTGRG